MRGEKKSNTHVSQLVGWWWCGPIPTDSHVVATTTLVSIRHANCVCCSSCCPREGSRRAKPCRMDTKTDLRFCEGRRRAIKCFAHAHSVSGSIQHCFAPLQPSRGRQEELHTQFASWMETKIVVATMWLPVGIGLNYPYFQTTMETSTPACTATRCSAYPKDQT